MNEESMKENIDQNINKNNHQNPDLQLHNNKKCENIFHAPDLETSSNVNGDVEEVSITFEKINVSDEVTERLLLSESDEENISPICKKSKKKLAVINSDSEKEDAFEEKSIENEVPIKFIDNLMDSSREDNKSQYIQNDLGKATLIDDYCKKNETTIKFQHNENLNILKYKTLIDSESESEVEIKNAKHTLKSNLYSKRRESEEENSIDNKLKKNIISSLVDSDNDNREGNAKEVKAKIKKLKKERPKRASAIEAVEQIKAIKSETQRLTRETLVKVPYHKPKKHSLKEFLTRKTIIRPDNLKYASLKMSQEKLEEFAKHLEERAKEATEFFKSDSDNEKEDIYSEVQTKTQSTEEMQENEAVKVLESEVQSTLDNQKLLDNMQESEEQKICTVHKDKNNSQLESVESIEQAEELTEIKELEQLMDEQRSCTPIPVNEIDEISSKSVFAKDAFKKRIAESELSPAPVLKGDPNMIIDLETGYLISPKPSVVDTLLQRFLKSSVKLKQKPAGSVKILSTENNKIEEIMISLTSHNSEEDEKVDQKPGAAYIKFKNDLKEFITNKRKEEIIKKLKENETYEKEKKEEPEENDSLEKANDFDDGDEEDINDLEEEMMEVDENEELTPKHSVTNRNHNNDDDADYKADDEDGDYDEDVDGKENSDEDEEGDNENEKCYDDSLSEIRTDYKVKSRIITAYENSDDETEKITKAIDDILNEPISTCNDKLLWQDTELKPFEDEESELLELCSGKFDENTQRKPLISQIPRTQIRENISENELWDLCSGTFKDEKKKETCNDNFAITNVDLNSSDEDAVVDEVKAKKKKKLGFSDDENEDYANPNNSYDEEFEKIKKGNMRKVADKEATDNEDEPGENANEEEDEPIETYIDYDPEENEIEVQMTKQERQQKVAEYFENEAELSESDWGSADEDENNLDKYDIELGDEEQYDKNELRTELGKIHLRKMLDEDIKEVKKIQDLLFEDEENDGLGRQRQFRWKNAEDGFNLDNPSGGDVITEENAGSDDEENEQKWRKMRHERELLLKEKQMDEIKISHSTEDIKLFAVNNVAIVKNTSTNWKNSDTPFLISKTLTTAIRGSFLVRDKETLTKLATLTKPSGATDSDGLNGTVSSGKAGKFVFTALSETEQMNLKRKSPYSGDNEKNVPPEKKQKTSKYIRSQKRLIDHL